MYIALKLLNLFLVLLGYFLALLFGHLGVYSLSVVFGVCSITSLYFFFAIKKKKNLNYLLEYKDVSIFDAYCVFKCPYRYYSHVYFLDDLFFVARGKEVVYADIYENVKRVISFNGVVTCFMDEGDIEFKVSDKDALKVVFIFENYKKRNFLSLFNSFCTNPSVEIPESGIDISDDLELFNIVAKDDLETEE